MRRDAKTKPLLAPQFRSAMFTRLRSIVLRVVIATLIAWIIAIIPIPAFAPHTWFVFVQVPIVVFFLICYIGKLIVDTFFYNHYQP